MAIGAAERADICKAFEIPPEGADLLEFFFTEQELKFILQIASGEVTQPFPADIGRRGANDGSDAGSGSPVDIDVPAEYRRGLISKTDETGAFYRLNNFYGFLDAFCVSNHDKYSTLPWEKRVSLDDWYFNAYVKTLDNGQWPPTADTVVPLEEMVEGILADPRPVYLNYCDCRSLTGECGLPRRTCITYKNGINTFADRGLSEQIDAERAADIVRQAEKDGLMHTRAMGGICNCCGDCCYLFRAQRVLNSIGTWPASAWIVSFDPDKCIGCGLCKKRCHLGVFTKKGPKEVSADTSRCVGCGICTSTCPKGALTLIKRSF